MKIVAFVAALTASSGVVGCNAVLDLKEGTPRDESVVDATPNEGGNESIDSTSFDSANATDSSSSDADDCDDAHDDHCSEAS